MNDPMGWMAGREPSPPQELGIWLRVRPVKAESVAVTLSGAALEHLDEALARPGRNREGALHLLAADALMTYACEAAAEEPEAERILSSLLAAVGAAGASSTGSGP